eukprot:365711-Chlamydomonas_euryale.AAC.16
MNRSRSIHNLRHAIQPEPDIGRQCTPREPRGGQHARLADVARRPPPRSPLLRSSRRDCADCGVVPTGLQTRPAINLPTVSQQVLRWPCNALPPMRGRRRWKFAHVRSYASRRLSQIRERALDIQQVLAH